MAFRLPVLNHAMNRADLSGIAKKASHNAVDLWQNMKCGKGVQNRGKLCMVRWPAGDCAIAGMRCKRDGVDPKGLHTQCGDHRGGNTIPDKTTGHG